MLKLLSKLFGAKQQTRHEKFDDSILGTLSLTEDDDWKASVTIGEKTIRFIIGGNVEPDHALIAHAHDIVRTFPEFEATVMSFLAEEGRRMKMLPSQISQLAIDDIMLCWSDRPNDGMIYFTGLDHIGVWHCEYVDRKPKGLGFDS